MLKTDPSELHNVAVSVDTARLLYDKNIGALVIVGPLPSLPSQFG